MGDLVVELLPAMIGLAVTPAAITGGILLLGTSRPFGNAVSFMSAFVLVYAIIAGLVVGAATADAEPLLSQRSKAIVQLVMGVLLLALAVGGMIRRSTMTRDPRNARRRSIFERLDQATPPVSFAIGLLLALLNPNVAILLGGLATVAAASADHVEGAVLLVAASVVGIAVPILWRWLAPRSSMKYLASLKSWMISRANVINTGILVVFGLVFSLKGLGGV